MLIERHTESLMKENDISAVFVEDINLRKNVKTFKNLAQLQGVLLNLFEKTGIAYDTILPSKWQGYCKARGRTLKEQKGEITSVRLQGKSPSKILSIEFVKDNFGIDTTNDNIADAICIGWYVVNNIRIASGKSDFKENDR